MTMRWTPSERTGKGARGPIPGGDEGVQRPDPESEAAADQVLVSLDEQRSLYVQLDELSRTQRDLIDRADSDGLLEVLRRRQELIVQIERIGRELGPIKRRWDQFMRSLDAESKALIERRLDALTELARGVAERDEQDRAVLADRRDRVASELGGLTRGRSASSAYRGTGTDGPRYQDRRV